jgi:hypothetical protein
MATYRIKKGKRLFKAARIATLTELVARGLLEAGDLISVDGAAFRPASELPALRGVFARAAVADIGGDGDKLPGPTDDTAGRADGVLEAFLSDVSDAEVGAGSGRVSISPPGPRVQPGSLPVVGRLERERSHEPITELASTSIEVLPSDSPDLERAGSFATSLRTVAAVPPSPPATAPSDEVDFAAAQRRLEAMAAGAGAPVVPMSFSDWISKRDEPGSAKSVLENFGVDDTLVALQMAKPINAQFSMLRVFLLVVLGGSLVGGWYIYVRTGAVQQFPTESELAQTAAPTPDPREAATPLSPPVQLRDAQLRARVGSNIRAFGNPAELKDAIFMELQNLGCRPLQVEVKVLASRGVRHRPTEIELDIRQAAVPAGDAKQILAHIQDRLGMTWMLVGKYGEKGKVTARTVTVQLEGQAVWKRDGNRLVALYKGATSSSDLFLKE